MGHIVADLHFEDGTCQEYTNQLCFTFLNSHQGVTKIVYRPFPGRILSGYSESVDAYLRLCAQLFPGFPKQSWDTMVRHGAEIATDRYPGSYVQWLLRLLRDISDFPPAVEACAERNNWNGVPLIEHFMATTVPTLGLPRAHTSKLSSIWRFLVGQIGSPTQHPRRAVHRAVEIGFGHDTAWALWTLAARLKQKQPSYCETGSYYDVLTPEKFVLWGGASSAWAPPGAHYGEIHHRSIHPSFPDALIEAMVGHLETNLRKPQ